MVSRQGTNQFHGALWEFVRNDVFNARSFFDLQKPKAARISMEGRRRTDQERQDLRVWQPFEMNTDRSRDSHGSHSTFYSRAGGRFFVSEWQEAVGESIQRQYAVSEQSDSAFAIRFSVVDGFAIRSHSPQSRRQIAAFGDAPKDAKLFMIRNDILLTPNRRCSDTTI